jgi:hypothetical protein
LAAFGKPTETHVPEPALTNDIDCLEEATDQAISACDGDVRAAVKALVIANASLESELAKARSLLSFGYIRGRFSRGKANPAGSGLGSPEVFTGVQSLFRD